ncbi:DNA polymerase alpha/epsilon subunit B-domain-containing protein [Phellopilus nigrolimitatus]|nr:DNA polymerase alpha/epsilon subunit B-domain-containing protein [Phellopilus nigrolimitatus]
MSACKVLPVPTDPLARLASAQSALPNETPSFVFGPSHKSYKHQFANMYFTRLSLLKGSVEKRARERWRGLKGSPPLVPRVLDVVKSQLCFIVGTVYMDMLQKPNVLEDVGRDRSLPAPPVRSKYHSPDDTIMLEDESGRVQLVGEALRRDIDTAIPEDEAMEGSQSGWGNLLVTGVIMAALGRETSSGAFEVKDVCFAGMAPMMYKSVVVDDAGMDVDENEAEDDWVAFISGLEFGETSASDSRIQLLVDYLEGEGAETEEQNFISRISRLIIAGDSLEPVTATLEKPSIIEVGLKSRRFGQEASNFSSVPTNTLGNFLADVAQTMKVHLLAGATDPSGTLLPQQPLPRAMFGTAKSCNNFSSETNPVWLGIESVTPTSSKRKKQRSLLVHSGQSVEDMYKYVPSPPSTRLDLACAALQWRHAAPSAPDTLWCYPYLTADPFVLHHTPDLYVLGCQPEYATRLVSSTDYDGPEEESGEKLCRVVLVPRFKETGTLVIVNMKNLEVKRIEFGRKGHNRSTFETHSSVS